MPTKKDLEAKIALLNDALETALAVSPVQDNNFFTQGGLSSLYTDPLNRNAVDRKRLFAEALRAWRVNPTARRIIRLQKAFIIGSGWAFDVKRAKKGLIQKAVQAITGKEQPEPTKAFIDQWSTHRLNNLKKNLKRWYDELYRTGNLFLLFTVKDNGMTFVRAVPAEQIESIKTDENDIEQELRYEKDSTGNDFWEAYDPLKDQSVFMLHYTVNQPVGCSWGESDFATLLVWIGRYASFLEDRVRLNRFRSAFMFVVEGDYKSETDRAARELHLNANPPKSGSILVLNRNNGEKYGILGAQLDSFDANTDMLAVKKNIMDGAGQPLHWHAEPESAMKATAEAAGTPSFRTLEEDQGDFIDILSDVIKVVLSIRAKADSKVNPKAELEIGAPDITQRDNATLALALARSFPALAELYDRKLLDDDKFLKLVYRFMAEPFEGEVPKGLRKPLTSPGPASTQPASPAEDQGSDETDPPTDEE